MAGSPYPITASAAIGTGLANYSISYVAGQPDRHPGPADRHRQRPEPPVRHAQPGPRRHHQGFVNGETLATSDVTGSPACSTTAVTTSPVSGSPYPITCSRGHARLDQLHVRFAAGELTITAAVADIAVTGYTVPYDGLPHTATGTATGALGEDLAGLLDLSATTHTAAGTYPVDAWTFHDPAGNYADASGTVADAITAGTLVDHRRRPVQALRHPFTFAGTEFTVTGLVSADSVDSVTLARPAPPPRPPWRARPYPITASAAVGTGLANYTVSYVPGS